MGAPATARSQEDPAGLSELRELEPEVVRTVRRWVDVAAGVPADSSAEQLAGMLRDPQGLAFTVGFVDRVIRPEDTRVAARNFAELARSVPAFLPPPMRAAVKLGAAVGLLAPDLVIPVARRTLRRMVGHLVIDARDRPLTKAIRRLRATGARLNVNLLGEAVLGEREAANRLETTRALLARPDVDYVSIKVSAAVAPHSPWSREEAVRHVVTSLHPLFQLAVDSAPHKFINLDMEEYHDLDLTVEVFIRLLDRPEFHELHAGIVLQAYLPDTLATMMHLQDWAAQRVSDGGAPIKVRVVKGANLPMERVEATLHDWPLATWHTKQDTDTNYKRLLDYALRPERVANVRVGVAGHNLFDIAFAWLLATRRDALAGADFEMLLGMAQGQAEAVRRDVGELLLYTPVVHPKAFDVAIAYLVRRLEEGASADNFMSAVFELSDDDALFRRERERFAASLAALDREVPPPHRDQDRGTPRVEGEPGAFVNAADTDPAVPANKRWGGDILARVATSTVGLDLADAATLTTEAELAAELTRAVNAGPAWAARSGAERAAVLRAAAAELERRRAQLIEVMAAECGKTIDQADPEVSEAIDFANYYAGLAEELDVVDGATHRAVGLTLVTPPWNFPIAIPAGSTIAALAAGSAVVVKAAPQARRCAAVMIDALHAAGVPHDVLRPVNVDEGDLGRALVADPRVERCILTGGYATAELFRTFRPELALFAETSGKNAIVVTPSADLDLAVKDVVASAFGHAGQKCSAASLVILVGSVARSRRFRTQLVDAVQSLEVGWPQHATSRMGPLIEPAQGKLLDALTALGPGESWLVRPRKLDQTGRLWTPGVRAGVRAGSDFHLIEYFGPVLGVMHAATLADALALQNAVPYGLTAGLHSLDAAEIASWLDNVQAGNLYVNRGITGAIVQRQPFGGWKRSAVGAGTKAGGPNYLVALSDWEPDRAVRSAALAPQLAAVLAAARGAGLDGTERLARAWGCDAAAWTAEFGVARDVTQLAVERNVLRYRPHPVLIRYESGPLIALVRVIGAGLLAGAPLTVSASVALPSGIAELLVDPAAQVDIHVEDTAAWRARVAGSDDIRIRLIGGDPETVHRLVDGRPGVAVYAQPVTEAGRIELLPFLREQAISITAHRFGTPDHLTDDVLPVTA